MFRAVRQWWSRGRGKVTARLFLFEIVVVMVGVLLAQGLQQAMADRSAHRHMVEERVRAREQLSGAHMMFRVWEAAVPCLDARMSQIMAGGGADAKLLRRPIFPVPSYLPPDQQSLLLIGDLFGQDERDLYIAIADNVANLQDRSGRIIDSWGRFDLLDPANGVPTADDRADVRRAAADIKAQLKSLKFSTMIARKRLERLQIPAFVRERPWTGPAQSCDAIWNNGNLDPPLGMR
jgi:hypothetical protein